MAYPGGKNGAGVYQRIICMMPPHQTYIEPFMGGAAILRLKRPAALNIAMDLYPPAVEEFRKLLPPLDAACEAYASQLAWSDPPSRDLAGSAELARNGDSSGSGGSARVTIADTTRSGETVPRSHIAIPDERRRAATPKWTILQRDGLKFLENLSPDLASATSLVYCDPPYMRETRSGGRLYEHEMSDVEHRRLLRWAIDSPCRVMISGYWSKLYGSTLQKWRCSRFQAMTRGGLAEECVWCNFPEPTELHDYRYLGEGFRERERIKRKTTRWTARLARMPLLERQCLLAALGQFQGTQVSPNAF